MVDTKKNKLANWTTERLMNRSHALKDKRLALESQEEEVNKELHKRLELMRDLLGVESSEEAPVKDSKPFKKVKATPTPKEGTCGAELPLGGFCKSTKLEENGRCILHEDDEEYTDKYLDAANDETFEDSE